MDAATYSEEASSPHVQQIPLSHLSLEVGHFYMDEITDGDGVEERVRRQYDQVTPIARAVRDGAAAGRTAPRISTCFLLDDYFTPTAKVSPKTVVERIQRVATEHGLPIDYVVREGACAVADGIPLAEMTQGMLLAEPTPGSNGSRPPDQESGWVCNGERSASEAPIAMRPPRWSPPVESSKFRHSIFMDVEMWSERTERVGGERKTLRTWSCPYLAAIWHLLRLGMLRHDGNPVAVPQLLRLEDEWPEHWLDLPAVIRLNPQAAPFAAYRSASVLPQTYLHIEHASRVILEHLHLDDTITSQLVDRAKREGVDVPADLLRRMTHFFVEGS